MGPWPGHHQEQDVLGNCRKKRIRVCSLPESVPGDEGGVRLGQVCLRTDCRQKSLACGEPPRAERLDTVWVELDVEILRASSSDALRMTMQGYGTSAPEAYRVC